jgi:adenine deaminase
MPQTRHVARTLTDEAWQITDAEGQHTARVIGTENDAVTRAQHQLAADGGGNVLVTDSD